MKRAAAVIALIAGGCGYHLSHAPPDALGPFTVAAGKVYAPDAAAMAAAEEGARAELSRAGQLAPAGAGGARIEIEILRVDEGSLGIATGPAGAPLARGLSVTVIGRARVSREAGGADERDTGDVEESFPVARAADAASAIAARDEAARAAARRLGERLVRRALGQPEPGGF